MARQVYKNLAGKRLIGVTTADRELGWNSGVLIDWAFRLGKAHPEWDSTRDYVDPLAEIGSIAHDIVLCKTMGKAFDSSKYSPNQVDKATHCVDSFDNWAKGKVIEPILCEVPLVSEEFQFGGCPDFYGKVDGVLTLLDYKTGKGIYDEYVIQTAGGYRILLEEQGYKVERIEILNIPRSHGESFQVRTVALELWEPAKKVFLNCLDNYQLHKLIKGE